MVRALREGPALFNPICVATPVHPALAAYAASQGIVGPLAPPTCTRPGIFDFTRTLSMIGVLHEWLDMSLRRTFNWMLFVHHMIETVVILLMVGPRSTALGHPPPDCAWQSRAVDMPHAQCSLLQYEWIPVPIDPAPLILVTMSVLDRLVSTIRSGRAHGNLAKGDGRGPFPFLPPGCRSCGVSSLCVQCTPGRFTAAIPTSPLRTQVYPFFVFEHGLRQLETDSKIAEDDEWFLFGPRSLYTHANRRRLARFCFWFYSVFVRVVVAALIIAYLSVFWATVPVVWRILTPVGACVLGCARMRRAGH